MGRVGGPHHLLLRVGGARQLERVDQPADGAREGVEATHDAPWRRGPARAVSRDDRGGEGVAARRRPPGEPGAVARDAEAGHAKEDGGATREEGGQRGHVAPAWAGYGAGGGWGGVNGGRFAVGSKRISQHRLSHTLEKNLQLLCGRYGGWSRGRRPYPVLVAVRVEKEFYEATPSHNTGHGSPTPRLACPFYLFILFIYTGHGTGAHWH